MKTTNINATIANNTTLNTVITNLVSTIEKSDINLLNTLNTEFKALDFSKYDYNSFITYCTDTLDNRAYISKDKKANYLVMFNLLSLNKFYRLNLNKVQFYILLQDKNIVNKLTRILTNDIKIDTKVIFTGTHYTMFKEDISSKNYVNSGLIPAILKLVNKAINKIVKTIPVPTKEITVDTNETKEEVIVEAVTTTKDTDYIKLFKRDIKELKEEGISKEDLIAMINSIY